MRFVIASYSLVGSIKINPAGSNRIKTAVVGAVNPVTGEKDRIAVIINAVAFIVAIANHRKIGVAFEGN